MYRISRQSINSCWGNSVCTREVNWPVDRPWNPPRFAKNVLSIFCQNVTFIVRWLITAKNNSACFWWSVDKKTPCFLFFFFFYRVAVLMTFKMRFHWSGELFTSGSNLRIQESKAPSSNILILTLKLTVACNVKGLLQRLSPEKTILTVCRSVQVFSHFQVAGSSVTVGTSLFALGVIWRLVLFASHLMQLLL